MVLLCNDNAFNIKKHHILKCLEKKKENFKIFIDPLKEPYIIEKAPNMNIQLENLTDKDIEQIFNDVKKK